MYKLYARPGDRLKEWVSFGRPRHREHWALRDISLEIRKGETFCIIGENGSGKSTLLKLIAGILEPTSGAIRTRGRLTALLELGAGFNPEFTGRQNLFLSGAILGLSTREVQECLESIVAFAEIGSYLDQPVKTYSSGMAVRLGFALAAHLHPEILVVDEALAVGDVYFRHRSMRKIHELRARGVTIVYVTHDIADIKAIGSRALWLDHGRIRELGDPIEIAHNYLAALMQKDSEYLLRQRVAVAATEKRVAPPEIITALPPGAKRYGDGRVRVLGIEVTDPEGRPIEAVRTPAHIVVRTSFEAVHELAQPIAGILLRNEQGVDISGANTARENLAVEPMTPGEIRTFDFHLKLPELAPGIYTFTPAIAEGELVEFRVCDLVESAATLRVLPGEQPVYGSVRLPCVVKTEKFEAEETGRIF